MSMEIGDIAASGGMAQAIYDQIAANLEPDIAELKDADKEPVREGWQKLAHAIATGVVNHIQANLELLNLTADGAPELPVDGNSAAADPVAGHTHAAGGLTVTIDDVLFR